MDYFRFSQKEIFNMSKNEDGLPKTWKHPDELIKLQRLKQKKKQLTARLNQNNNNFQDIKETDKERLLEAKISQKRRNPFCKNNENAKKPRTDSISFEQDDSSQLCFDTPSSQAKELIIRETPTRPPPAKLVLQPFDPKAFANLLHQPSAAADEDVLEKQKYTKHLPMDWSLKTRVRLFCHTELPATTLKSSQIASGLTSFSRCIDAQSSCCGLDISPAALFNKATYYWQHPYLPWMTLFPRNSKDNSGIVVSEQERKSLANDWDCSFRGLYQLLRARQCPYFYLCANTFTVLFRAAGTAGIVETHALLTPTTRGLRQALRQEGIEYTMPLKTDVLVDANKASPINNVTNAEEADCSKEFVDDDDEQEEDDWLESLGVDEKEIRKIQTAHERKLKAKEMSVDFSENSLLLIEGVECQGLFSFLLNAKSTVVNVGRLAGVPPTLLAPVAFPKATMQDLATRSNKVRLDGIDYFSIEVKGIVLPTFLPYVFDLLGESKDTFSATLASSNATLAFSKATQKLLEQPQQSDEQQNDGTSGQVFGLENLSDCGLLPVVIKSICRTGEHAVSLLEHVCYNKEFGYAWS